MNSDLTQVDSECIDIVDKACTDSRLKSLLTLVDEEGTDPG